MDRRPAVAFPTTEVLTARDTFHRGVPDREGEDPRVLTTLEVLEVSERALPEVQVDPVGPVPDSKRTVLEMVFLRGVAPEVPWVGDHRTPRCCR